MAEPPESPAATEGRIPCPSCGTRYKWKAELAGRKLKCRCGALIRMPKEAAGAATLEQPASSPPVEAKPQPPLPPPASPTAPQSPATGDPDDSYDLELSDLAQAAPTPAAATDPIARPTKTLENSAATGANPAKAADAGRCPSCGQPVKPNAVICLGCGFNLKSGQKIQTEVEGEAPASTHKQSGAKAPSSADESRPKSAKSKKRIVLISLFALGFGLAILSTLVYLGKIKLF